MSDTGQNRSEAPTERRREDSRRRGQVAYSHELTGGLAFALGIIVLWTTAADTWQAMGRLLRNDLLMPSTAVWSAEMTRQLAWAATQSCAALVAPVLLSVWGIAVVAGVAQTRALVTFEPLSPDLSRFSPGKGWKRIWSPRALVKVAQVLGRATILGIVAFQAVAQEIDYVQSTPYVSLHQVAWRAGELALKIAAVAAVLLLGTGVVDYLFEWWKHENDLKMTLREVKDERKQDEGDPHLKARLRRLQREMNKQQMLKRVPTADVIVRNPTHYAVALKYDRHKMAAPQVVAKGKDYLALRIIDIAQEHRVPVVERKPLARALFHHVEAGQEIPVALYHVVAEVLIYVDRLRRAG